MGMAREGREGETLSAICDKKGALFDALCVREGRRDGARFSETADGDSLVFHAFSEHGCLELLLMKFDILWNFSASRFYVQRCVTVNSHLNFTNDTVCGGTLLPLFCSTTTRAATFENQD